MPAFLGGFGAKQLWRGYLNLVNSYWINPPRVCQMSLKRSEGHLEEGQWSRNLVGRRHKAKASVSNLQVSFSSSVRWRIDPNIISNSVLKWWEEELGYQFYIFKIKSYQEIPLCKLDSSRISLVRGGHGSQDAPGKSEAHVDHSLKNSTGDLFWTPFYLDRTCSFVDVIHMCQPYGSASEERCGEGETKRSSIYGSVNM